MKLKELESLMQASQLPHVTCGRRLGCTAGTGRGGQPRGEPAQPSTTLQDIAPFANPKIELEQYPTGPHLASRLLYTVRAPCG